MTEETVTEAVVDPALAPPPDDPPVEPAAPEPEPPQRRMVPEDVFVREITPLRSRVRETETENERLRRQLRESTDLLTRLQQKPGDNGATPPAPRTEPIAEPPQTDIERRAAEMLFTRDAQRISETAYRTYGQGWIDSVNLLNSFGLNSGDFVSSVMDVVGSDKTHEVMHAIAQEPEKAAALAGMSPARRISEITRISLAMDAKPVAAPTEPVKPAPPPAKTVSRAPAPPPPVEPSASKVVDWRDDKASDADFSRGFDEMMAKKRARR
jgi:hypothetical protein